MKRFGLCGLVLAVSIFGACNDNGGGSGFGIPNNQVGQVTILIGSSPSCVGGTNDTGVCSPNVDCDDSFCTLICIDDQNFSLCNTNADCVFGNCDYGCDRGIDQGLACDPDGECPGGACTTALIHDFDYEFTYTGDSFSQVLSSNTDNDGDGYTPALLLDTAPLGTEGSITVDFLDGVADCVDITWGTQQTQVFNTCGQPIDASFTFPE